MSEKSKEAQFETKIIGAFNTDENDEVHYTRKCRYLSKKFSKPGPVEIDLNKGDRNNVSRREVSQEKKIDYLLKYIMRHNKDLETKPDFVCSSGTLQQILCAPYFPNYFHNPTTILATKFKGTIYLCTQTAQNHHKKDQVIKLKNIGWKFPQSILTGEYIRYCFIKMKNNILMDVI